MKNFQESDFKVEIPSFSKDPVSTNTIFYDIIVTYQEKKWKLIKRYREFEDLHNKLNKIILNMPYLPAKSLFKLTGVDIEKRRLDLEKYLRALGFRKDIAQLPDFLNFIEFESYSTNEIFSPQELGALTNLSMGVSDFVFIKEEGVLFVSLCDTSILSKMDDIFSTFTNKNSNDYRGCVLAYKLEGNTPLKFSLLWKKDFKNGTTCLYWDEALTFLAVGFDDGSCECIRVSTEHNYKEFDEFCIVKRHTSRVTGCGFFSLLATLYTISKDKSLVVTDITKTVNFALEEKTFLNELTYLLVDNANKRMFIADSLGNIHIYGLDIPLKLYHKIPCEYPQYCSILSMDIKKRFLLAGTTQGMIYIYELGKPGKEKLISLTSKIETSKNLKSLAFSILDKNLYFNYGNTVIFMDSIKASPYYSLDKHKNDIVKIMLLDSEKVLITASKDKSVKFWRLRDATESNDQINKKQKSEKISKKPNNNESIKSLKKKDSFEDSPKESSLNLFINEDNFNNMNMNMNESPINNNLRLSKEGLMMPLKENPLKGYILKTNPLNENQLEAIIPKTISLNQNPLLQENLLLKDNSNFLKETTLLKSENTLKENSLKENPLKENPLKENPLKENPLKENPLKENPLKENPLKENPLKENLLKENPLKENLLKENPLKENPLKENPLKENPLKENPLKENPLKENPLKEYPSKENPPEIKETMIRMKIDSLQFPKAMDKRTELATKSFSFDQKKHPYETFVENSKSDATLQASFQPNPTVEFEDEDDLKGWHDNSNQLPLKLNEQPISSIKKANESKNITEKILRDEEEKNDLHGWDEPVSYTPINKNPLLGNLERQKFAQKAPPLNQANSNARPSKKTNEKNIKNKYDEEEEELSGWNQ